MKKRAGVVRAKDIEQAVLEALEARGPLTVGALGDVLRKKLMKNHADSSVWSRVSLAVKSLRERRIVKQDVEGRTRTVSLREKRRCRR